MPNSQDAVGDPSSKLLKQTAQPTWSNITQHKCKRACILCNALHRGCSLSIRLGCMMIAEQPAQAAAVSLMTVSTGANSSCGEDLATSRLRDLQPYLQSPRLRHVDGRSGLNAFTCGLMIGGLQAYRQLGLQAHLAFVAPTLHETGPHADFKDVQDPLKSSRVPSLQHFPKIIICCQSHKIEPACTATPGQLFPTTKHHSTSHHITSGRRKCETVEQIMWHRFGNVRLEDL